MRVLFCHDGPLRRDENNNYYGLGHNDDTFKRYFNIADEISVVIRVKNIMKSEAEAKYSKITVKPIQIIECADISSIKGYIFKKKNVKTTIKHAVLESDYIIARLPSMIGSIAFDYAKKFNKPCLVELVSCPWGSFWNHSWKGKVVAPIMRYITRNKLSKASYVIYVTNQFLQNRYPTKGKSIGCSDVALPNLSRDILEKRLNKIKNMKRESPIILGTIAAVNVRYKGQEYVIKAIAKLKEKGFNIEYHLVGGGASKYLLDIAKNYGVEKNVKFLGSLKHEQVFEYLDNIDIYIQPSLTEGLPRALVEAMSRGLPAIGTTAGGIPELLDRECIVKKKSVDEIVDKFLNLNKAKLCEYAERNFEEAKKYEKQLLDDRRLLFYSEFRDH